MKKMRILFISDIHGIKKNLKTVEERLKKEHFDLLVVLGDLFYIGPRNDLKEEYDISYVRNFLDTYKEKIICMRGNCDSEIDVEVCDFPILTNLGYIQTDGLDIYLTHGHIYNEKNWNKENTILVFGHYHIPFIKEIGNNIYINPGSISLPKEGNPPSYMIYEDRKFTIYDKDNNIMIEKEV